MLRFERIQLLIVGFLIAIVAPVHTWATEQITIATWGGPYQRSQVSAYFAPFTEKTGIEINLVPYKGGLEEIRAQVGEGEVIWDLVDILLADDLEACDEGLLEPLDKSNLAPAPDGTPASEDFLTGALVPCGVSQIVYAMVIAFNPRAFPGSKPTSAADLFDLERFPGKRALEKKPIAVLEWALRSYGVPRADIYSLLSTQRGLDLAFRRLDQIRDAIVWWQDPKMPVELLGSGEVVMASGYNGRFFDADVNQGMQIQTIWESQIYEYAAWGIPKGAPNRSLAEQFIAFATATEQLAALSSHISYGPARLSSNEAVWKHTGSGRDMRPYLPTYLPHFSQGIAKDYEWYARSRERLEERFNRWLEE